MAYTPIYEKPYENGWDDLPSEITPVTAEILDQYDDTFEHIEEYLEQGGGGGGTDTSIIAEEYDENESYSENQYVIYEDKLYICVIDTFGGEFDPSDWLEVTVGDELEYLRGIAGITLRRDQTGYVNSDLNRAEKAFVQGEIFVMGYGNRVAVALTNIALGDSLVLHTNYEYTTLSEQIVNSGGGGGSEVEITPTLQSGTKIADFEIDGVPGELYAPTGGGSANMWTGTQAEYNAQASQIADGTLVNITDDEEEIAIAESESF